jgi:hypothetical protein
MIATAIFARESEKAWTLGAPSAVDAIANFALLIASLVRVANTEHIGQCSVQSRAGGVLKRPPRRLL